MLGSLMMLASGHGRQLAELRKGVVDALVGAQAVREAAQARGGQRDVARLDMDAGGLRVRGDDGKNEYVASRGASSVRCR